MSVHLLLIYWLSMWNSLKHLRLFICFGDDWFEKRAGYRDPWLLDLVPYLYDRLKYHWLARMLVIYSVYDTALIRITIIWLLVGKIDPSTTRWMVDWCQYAWHTRIRTTTSLLFKQLSSDEGVIDILATGWLLAEVSSVEATDSVSHLFSGVACGVGGWVLSFEEVPGCNTLCVSSLLKPATSGFVAVYSYQNLMTATCKQNQ